MAMVSTSRQTIAILNAAFTQEIIVPGTLPNTLFRKSPMVFAPVLRIHGPVICVMTTIIITHAIPNHAAITPIDAAFWQVPQLCAEPSSVRASVIPTREAGRPPPANAKLPLSAPPLFLFLYAIKAPIPTMDTTS